MFTILIMLAMLMKTSVFVAAAAALSGMDHATALVPKHQLSRDVANTTPNLTHIICQPQMYREAREDYTLDGIKYLRNKPQDPLGPPYFAPGTNNGHCTRVSCEYASAIYVCNDNEDRGVQIPLDTVADYAQAVLNDTDARCNFYDKNLDNSGMAKKVVWGQAFDINDWNVVVGMWHFDDNC